MNVPPTASVPDCVDGQLSLHVNFPDCWDGKNLLYDNQKNTAYSVNGRCPTGLPGADAVAPARRPLPGDRPSGARRARVGRPVLGPRRLHQRVGPAGARRRSSPSCLNTYRHCGTGSLSATAAAAHSAASASPRPTPTRGGKDRRGRAHRSRAQRIAGEGAERLLRPCLRAAEAARQRVALRRARRVPPGRPRSRAAERAASPSTRRDGQGALSDACGSASRSLAAASAARRAGRRPASARPLAERWRPRRPDQRVVAVVEVDDAVVDVREVRAVPRRLVLDPPRAGCRVPTGTRPPGRTRAGQRGRIEGHAGDQLVVPDVELARACRGSGKRPAQIEAQRLAASASREARRSCAGRGRSAGRSSPPSRAPRRPSRSCPGRRSRRPSRRSRLPARRRAQDVARRARDERGRPLDPPPHREQLVGEPARVALARDLVQPARVVEVPAAALAREDDLHRTRVRRTHVARAGGRPGTRARQPPRPAGRHLLAGA